METFYLIHVFLIVKLNVLLFHVERLLNGTFNTVGINNGFVHIKGLVKEFYKDIVVFNVGDFKVKVLTVLTIDNFTVTTALREVGEWSVFEVLLYGFKGVKGSVILDYLFNLKCFFRKTFKYLSILFVHKDKKIIKNIDKKRVSLIGKVVLFKALLIATNSQFSAVVVA